MFGSICRESAKNLTIDRYDSDTTVIILPNLAERK